MTRDFSKLSNEELLRIAEQDTAQPTAPQPAANVSQMTDEELLSIARTEPTRQGFLQQAREAALEIGPGLGELAVGAVQRGAEVLGQEEFSRRLGEQQAREREQLTTAQRIGRGAGQILGTAPIAAGGALIPGVVRGAGAVAALTPTEEGTAEAAVKQIGTGVATGLATLGVIKGAGGAATKAKQLAGEGIKRVKAGVGARAVEDLNIAGTKLKEKASDVYQAMRDINANVTKKAGSRLVRELDNTLERSGKLNKNLHRNTLSVMEDIRDAAKKGDVGLEDLDQYRQLLNESVQKSTDRLTGSVDSDGQKSQLLISKLDDLIDNLKPNDLGVGGKQATDLLKQARSDWKTFKKFQRITNLVERAGDDPNRLKSAFQRFVANKKNLRGFTKDERDALVFAAENTGGEKLLKTLGKFGFDLGTSVTPGNTFLPSASIFGGILSGNLGGGVGAATAGTAARQLQKLVARGKIEDALTLIQQGGVRNVPEAISKIPSKKAQQELLTRLLPIGAAQQTTQ